MDAPSAWLSIDPLMLLAASGMVALSAMWSSRR